MLLDISTIIAMGGFVLALIGLLIEHFKYLSEIDKRVIKLEECITHSKGLDEKVSKLETKVEPFWQFVTNKLPDLMKGPNPRKDELLDKYKNKTINKDEKKELASILENSTKGKDKLLIALFIEVLSHD